MCFHCLFCSCRCYHMIGKIEKYERLGMDTPKGMVIDTEGKERTDTKQILIDMVKGKCALCPMGGAGDALGGYKVRHNSMLL